MGKSSPAPLPSASVLGDTGASIKVLMLSLIQTLPRAWDQVRSFRVTVGTAAAAGKGASRGSVPVEEHPTGQVPISARAAAIRDAGGGFTSW